MDFNPGSFVGVMDELKLFGLAALVGAVVGAVYDLLRVLRITFPHRFAAVFAEDLLFTLFFGMVYFCFSVEMLEGELRLYILVGMLAGFAIYLMSLGRIISGIFRAVANVIRKAVNFASDRLKNAAVSKNLRKK